MDIKELINGLGENRNEILKKASQCKSAMELLALAKANGINITETDAVELFNTMNVKIDELSDYELDAVAGGFDDCSGKYTICSNCGDPKWKCKCQRLQHRS